ncbi:hypothetical protein GUJ93_ZPchr0002g24939 [Zizania palustris]|uniref:Uncharacterized protein n=1 Tax=Zizania palustris TaxID=103762 RepID=A0A8J5VBZ5_ZIZPA|nr:hypothetical protein GUJ93_ZPchr0002g24939 [Zizania palustris]
MVHRGGGGRADQKATGPPTLAASSGWGGRGEGPGASTLMRVQLHADKDAAAQCVAWDRWPCLSVRARGFKSFIK